MGARRDAAREVAGAFVGVALVTIALHWAPLPLLADYRYLLLSALFLGAAIRLSERRPAGLAGYGLRLGGLLERPEDDRPGAWSALADVGRALLTAAPQGLRELAIAVAVAMVVFPPFALGFYLWHQPTLTFALQWSDAPASYLLTQLLVVALPEEALFRGYFQSRLHEAWPPRRVVLGVTIGMVPWVTQALLFALLHVATDMRPARLAVFFPGLLFGWLRQWRGGIGAAIALHALCNLFADVLARSWF
jgi:membrane protease YdiL (CAAX protease family)